VLELSKSVFLKKIYGRVSSEVEVVKMFTRVSRTYGSTFIGLLFLSYFTQGLRCFPWLAITYHFKDYLKVKKKPAKSPPLCCFLLVVFEYIANHERKQIFAC
jgi:hypothetical protein